MDGRFIKNNIKRIVFSVIGGVFLSLFFYNFVKAIPPLSPYLPGETLDPNCSPGDPNCTVLPSLTGTSTPGNIGFYTGTTTLSGDSYLFWDNLNKRLGIGTSTPAEKLHVEGNLKIGGENNLLFVSRGKKESNYGGPYDWYRGFIYLGRDLTPSDWYTDTLVPGVDSGHIVLGVDTDIGAFMPAVYDPNTLNYIRAANIEGASGIFQGDLYLQKSEGSSIFFKPGGNLVESSINFDNLNKKLSFIIKNPVSTPFEFKTENPFTGNFLTLINSSTNIFTLSSNGDIFSSGTLNVSTGTINNSLGIRTSNPLQPLHVQGNAYISGNLGIGISNPTNNLEVSGTSALFSSSGDFRISVSKGTELNTASILFQNNFSGRAEFGLTGDDKFHIKTSPDGSTWIESLVIDTNGNIGIGTTNPATRLQVFGTTTAQTILPEADNLYSLGAPGLRWANLYAATTSVGDLIFANQFRVIETDNLATTQALIFKNQRGEEIMRLDERGNLTLAGIIEGFFEKVKQVLSSLGILIENGIVRIGKLFVREITIDFAQIEKAKINELTSKKFCLEGDDGETICLDKNQVKELLNRSGGSYTIHGSNVSNTDNMDNNNNPQESVGTNTTSTNESNTNNSQESVSNYNQSAGESTTSSNESQQ
jgi:hypothetical protein